MYRQRAIPSTEKGQEGARGEAYGREGRSIWSSVSVQFGFTLRGVGLYRVFHCILRRCASSTTEYRSLTIGAISLAWILSYCVLLKPKLITSQIFN